MNHLLSALFGLSLLLSACAQAPQGARPSTGEVGETAVAWTYTAGGEAPDPLDQSSWSLVQQATNGWGPVEINSSVGEQGQRDGHPLTLGRRVYPAGLGLHAQATLTYDTAVAYGPAATCTLDADVGVDAEVGRRGSVVFQGQIDGETVYETEVLRGGDEAVHIHWTVPRGRNLTVTVTDAGDGPDYDHADLAAPTFSCVVAPAPAIALDSDRYSVYLLHRLELQARFQNFPDGPVRVRLEAVPSLRPDQDPVSGLDLRTRSVTDTSGPQTLVIEAPRTPRPAGTAPGTPADLTQTYRLVASVEGEEVRSAPFTISERLLTFRATLVSNAESIADHQGVNATLNLTVSPPLDALPDEEILSIAPADPSAPVTASVSGPVYGDGGTLYLPVRLEAGVLPADLSDLSSVSYLVTLRGVLGEQLPFYDPLTVRLSLPIRR